MRFSKKEKKLIIEMIEEHRLMLITRDHEEKSISDELTQIGRLKRKIEEEGVLTDKKEVNKMSKVELSGIEIGILLNALMTRQTWLDREIQLCKGFKDCEPIGRYIGGMEEEIARGSSLMKRLNEPAVLVE